MGVAPPHHRGHPRIRAAPRRGPHALEAAFGAEGASLADFVAEAKTLASLRERTLHVFGHVGLGILHLLMPLAGPGAWTRDEALAEKRRLALAAIAHGGTTSGEHGVGLGNRDLLAAEHPVGLDYMRRIKALFDPQGLLNPDKVLPGA